MDISKELLKKEIKIQNIMTRLQKAMNENSPEVPRLQKLYDKAKQGYDELVLEHFAGRV